MEEHCSYVVTCFHTKSTVIMTLNTKNPKLQANFSGDFELQDCVVVLLVSLQLKMGLTVAERVRETVVLVVE